MFELIVASDEKAQAQERMRNILTSGLPSQGLRKVGFQGGTQELELFSKGPGELWFGTRLLPDARIPRFWNAFGTFDPTRSSQTIALEINIATHQNSMQVSGFFARDSLTQTCLMHTGKVGGGTQGVGKKDFLAWSSSSLLPVFDRETETERLGIVIGVVDHTLIGSITQFVEQVASFKGFVKQGQH